MFLGYTPQGRGCMLHLHRYLSPSLRKSLHGQNYKEEEEEERRVGLQEYYL